MRNKILFSALLTGLTGGLLAQDEQPMAGSEMSPEVVNMLNHQSQQRLKALNTDRETIDGWVSFEQTEYNFTYGPDAFFTYGQVISPDSLARVSFTGGVFRSFTHGFGQIFDPTASDMDLTDNQLTHVDSYTIDSIGFPSIYRRVNHNDIDDTLLITVAITDKETSEGNPYDGSYWWTPDGLVSDDIYVMAPSYAGDPADGFHHGLTGTSDAGSNVEITQYKFALTEDDTELFWRSFPVDIEAEADQVVYTFVEYVPSFEATIEDTAFVFDGAEGVANTNSYRTIYDYPVDEGLGYFFDLYREDQYSYNASYVADATTRYAEHSGDDEWRNARLNVYSLWGFRFEYYMNAVSSVSIDEETFTDLELYPNPANSNSVLSFSKEIQEGQLSIVDINGRIVLNRDVKTLVNNKLNLEALNLSPGVYNVILTSEEDQSISKLIVK